MGYKRMDTEDLAGMYRRWRAGQAISHIASVLGLDRKTVRQYLGRFISVGLSLEGPQLGKQALVERLVKVLPDTERAKPAWEELSRYEGEAQGCLLCHALFDTLAEAAGKYGLGLDQLLQDLREAAGVFIAGGLA